MKKIFLLIFFALLNPLARGQTYLSETFDFGYPGWSYTGLWHDSDTTLGGCNLAYSGSHSFWYGNSGTCNFDVGTSSGTLTSPVFFLPAGSVTLQFKSWYDTECAYCSYDRREIWISLNGGPFNLVTQLSDAVTVTWVPLSVDLTSYSGNNVQIQFLFNSQDGAVNGGRGWFVDDVFVGAPPINAPYAEGFDGAPPSWVATGMWHSSDTSSSPPSCDLAYSPPRAYWYGLDSSCNFDNGSANSGALTSPIIHIPAGMSNPVVRFRSYWDTEPCCTYDRKRLSLQVNGGGYFPVLNLGDTDPQWTWDAISYDLSGYQGQDLEFQFNFDSGDNAANGGLGWFIDDFFVGSASAPTPTPTPSGGGSGTGALIVYGTTTGFQPNNYQTLANDAVVQSWAKGQAAPQDFAIFEDHNPWGYTIVKNAIATNGHSYSNFAISSLPGFPFSNYRVVVLNFDDDGQGQIDAGYNSGVKAALESYISAGGVVWIQGATQGASFSLPFGGTAIPDTWGQNYIVDTSHPLALGMANPYSGGSASHNSFSGLPAQAHIVAVGGGGPGGPTVIYEYDNPSPGRLIASGNTMGYFGGSSQAPLLNNTVAYAWNAGTPAVNDYAIFQSHDPWGFSWLRNAIATAGHAYSIFPITSLPGFTFSNYRVIVLNFDDHNQPDIDSGYNAGVRTALEAYTLTGGVVWIQTGTQGGNFPMPFGGNCQYSQYTDNYQPNPAHPVVAGMPNPFSGSAASHNIFVSLPAGAVTILTGGPAPGGPVVMYELVPTGSPYTPTPTNTPTPVGGGSYLGNQAPMDGVSDYFFDANNKKLSWRFRSRYTGTPAQFQIYVNNVVGSPTYRISVQGDSGGMPDGISNGAYTYFIPNPGWYNIFLNVPQPNLVSGTVYHLVMEYGGGSALGPGNYAYIRQGGSPNHMLYPKDQALDSQLAILQDNGAGWGLVPGYAPIFVGQAGGGIKDGNPYVYTNSFYIGGPTRRAETFQIGGAGLPIYSVGAYVKKDPGTPGDALYYEIRDTITNNPVPGGSGLLAPVGIVGNSYAWVDQPITPLFLPPGTYRLCLLSPGTFGPYYYWPEADPGYGTFPFPDLSYDGQGSHSEHSFDAGSNWNPGGANLNADFPFRFSGPAATATPTTSPDISLFKNPSQLLVGVNQSIHYDLVFQNNPASYPVNLKVWDTLPLASASYLGSSPAGGFYAPDGIGWNLGVVNPGNSQILGLDMQAPSTSPLVYEGNQEASTGPGVVVQSLSDNFGIRFQLPRTRVLDGVNMNFNNLTGTPACSLEIQTADGAGNPSGLVISGPVIYIPMSFGPHFFDMPDVTLQKGSTYFAVLRWQGGGTFLVQRNSVDQPYNHRVFTMPGASWGDAGQEAIYGLQFVDGGYFGQSLWGTGFLDRIYGSHISGEWLNYPVGFWVSQIGVYIRRYGNPSPLRVELRDGLNNPVFSATATVPISGGGTWVEIPVAPPLFIPGAGFRRLVVMQDAFGGDSSVNYYEAVKTEGVLSLTPGLLTYKGLSCQYFSSLDNGGSLNMAPDQDLYFRFGPGYIKNTLAGETGDSDESLVLVVETPSPTPTYTPDLSLVKSALPLGVIEGQTLTYSLRYSNGAGSYPVNPFKVWDSLPLAYVDYLGSSSGGSLSGNVVSWSLGTLSPGASGTVSIYVRAKPGGGIPQVYEGNTGGVTVFTSLFGPADKFSIRIQEPSAAVLDQVYLMFTGKSGPNVGMLCELQTDNGAGKPSGVVVGSVNVYPLTVNPPAPNAEQFAFNPKIPLAKGRTYHLVFTPSGPDSSTVARCSPLGIWSDRVLSYSGGAWPDTGFEAVYAIQTTGQVLGQTGWDKQYMFIAGVTELGEEYVAPSDMRVTSLGFYMELVGSSAAARMEIRNNANGVLASAPVSGVGPLGWYDAVFPAPVTLLGGQTYRLVGFRDGHLNPPDGYNIYYVHAEEQTTSYGAVVDRGMMLPDGITPNYGNTEDLLFRMGPGYIRNQGALDTLDSNNALVQVLPSPTFTATGTWTSTSTISPTSTSTPTFTWTPTSTPTVSATQTSTWTSTYTSSPTWTATGTFTSTISPTSTVTQTRTPTVTSTFTVSPTSTATPTWTSTVTPTFTVTSTSTATPTWTGTFTGTSTASPTLTATPTASWTQTATPSASPTYSVSTTDSPTWTKTSSPTSTWTFTVTPTATSTVTGTSTVTPTSTVTLTWTPTSSPTFTVTPTSSVTATGTPTSTPTYSVSPTSTVTPTWSSTVTSTSTITSTNTATPTWTGTFTATPTATASASPTYSMSDSQTSTRSATSTATPTSTVTGSATATVSPTSTASPSSTPTPSATAAATLTDSPSSSQTLTRTGTATPSWTPTDSLTATPTKTRTGTPTPSQTLTDSLTPSATRTVTPTSTVSPSASVTPTASATKTWSPSESPTSTSTRSLTLTVTFSPSATFTVTPTPYLPLSLSHNSFNPTQWQLRVDVLAPADGRTTVEAYNILGEKVRLIADWNAIKGQPFSYRWDGKNDSGVYIGNGVYILLLRYPGGVETKKVIVIK